MDRKELYREITSLNLQDEVKATYGKNYTQCTNAQLATVVSGATKALEEAVKAEKSKKSATEKKGEKCHASTGFNKLVEVLAKKKILLPSEVDAIMGA